MATVSQRGSVVVVAVSEPLTLDHIQEIAGTVDSALRGTLPRLVFDLSGTAIIDSSGLEFLLDTQESCLGSGGEVLLAGVTPLCREVLRITDLGKRFRFFPEVTSAVGSFAI